MPTLAAWFVYLLAFGFVAVCGFMMLVILIQKPRGGGLSGAFGGASGSAQAAFGAKTGDVLTYFTVACFVAFLLLAMGLTWAINGQVQPTTPEVAAPIPGSPAPGSPGDAEAPAVPEPLTDTAAEGPVDTTPPQPAAEQVVDQLTETPEPAAPAPPPAVEPAPPASQPAPDATP